MKFVLFFVAVFSTSGPTAEQPVAFDTKEKCEAKRKAIGALIEKHNASENPDKITQVALVCVAMKAAAKGLGV